ncbi:MAG: YhbY family RNA-binding protein [Pseudomonadales bacterium]|nr:YhbY family RNA-binding protein [Pseudomonadales bacterium]
MSLSSKQIKQFRAIGHHLNPVVIISSALSENVSAEILRALKDHELIKVRINAAERSEKQALAKQICASSHAELIQMIGNIALIYRAAKNPNPKLSNLLRHQIAAN